MKNRLSKSILALSMCVVTTLTGCSNTFIGEDVSSYPLGDYMSMAEAQDYYANSLKYDAIVSRNVNVHETTYEVVEIQGQKADRLKTLVGQCEQILGSEEYENSTDNTKLVSPDTYSYIRGTLDNDVLSNGTIKNITGALGYYFVDVEYTLSPKEPGTFTSAANLVGINGIFYLNYKNEYNIDESFLRLIAQKLDEYFYQNNIKRHCEFNKAELTIEIQDGVDPVVSAFLQTYEDDNTSNIGDINTEYVGDGSDIDTTDSSIEETDTEDGEGNKEVVDAKDTEKESDTTEKEADVEVDKTDADTEDTDAEVDENTDTEENNDNTNVEITSEVNTETSQNEIQVVIDDDIYMDANSSFTIVTPQSRRVDEDIRLINEVVGSSLRERAILPQLDYVYNIPSNEGTICGYGIYPSGNNGLKTFGFDRSKYSGTVTLRYVFKDDVTGTGDILGQNVYIIDEQVTNGITITDSNVLVPEFLMQQLSTLVERYDRAIVDNNIAALIAGSNSSGLIVEDMGVGILRGEREKSTNINKYMSTIRQIISRDTANNSYLVEVETTVIEGPKDVDCCGTYKDKYYMVIQQQNDKFVITDSVRISRTMQTEPPINPATNIQKKLVALNLAGPVDDESKASIKSLMSDLYTAGTNRTLNGKEITVDGKTQNIKGLKEIFTTDTSVMSSEDYDYTISKLQNLLTKYGADVSSIYSGTITEWIGGYDNQVEFTTEEFVYFPAKASGYYMQVYYLVSTNNDKWVVDERTVLDEYSVDGDTCTDICDRLGIPH